MTEVSESDMTTMRTHVLVTVLEGGCSVLYCCSFSRFVIKLALEQKKDKRERESGTMW